MPVPRIYTTGELRQGVVITLDRGAARHLRVLRLKPGAAVILFNGSGGHYLSTVKDIRSDLVTLDIDQHVAHETESPLEIILAQGISRGERMDYTIQKSVELGVNAIVPLLTYRCGLKLAGERAARRHLHWQGVVTSACEQCGRNHLPALYPVDALRNWLTGLNDEEQNTDTSRKPPGLKLVLDYRTSNTLSHYSRPSGPVILLIGPEGGLTDDELEHAEQSGFTRIRLGPRILRTETAGIAAISTLQSLWGDLL